MGTYISISEKTCTDRKVHPAMRREEKIIVHDGWMWNIGHVRDEKDLKEMLEFLEIEMTTIMHEVKYSTTGKVVFYNLSKKINNSFDGGFWNLEQLEKISQGQKLKKIKGLSNGSIVDCYVGIGEDVVCIYRPNPNAKDVYMPMELYEDIKYRKNNWYI